MSEKQEETALKVEPATHRKKFPATAVTAASRFMLGTSKRRGTAATLDLERTLGNIGKKLIVGDIVVVRAVDAYGTDGGSLAAQGLHDDIIGLYCDEDQVKRPTDGEELLKCDQAEFYFRICPQLRYDMQKSLEKMSRSDNYTLEQQLYLKDRADREEKENEELLQGWDKGHKTSVRYGQVIQLQHVKSGKFLTVASKKVAMLEKECLALELVEGGSESSWIQTMPRFKVRAEGATVYAGDQIYFRSAKQSDYFLHASSMVIPLNNKEVSTCTALSERKIWREANLAIKPDTWRLHLMMRGMDTNNNNTLFDGQPLYMFHPEVEALVSSSMNQQDSRAFLLPSVRDSLVKPDESVWILELAHADSAAENLANLMGKSRQDSESSRERRKRNNVGTIAWGDRISLRHALSGRYLSIDSSSLDPTALEERGLMKVHSSDKHLGPYSTFIISPVVKKKKLHLDDDDDDDDDSRGIHGQDTETANAHDPANQDAISLENLTFCLEFEPRRPIHLPDGTIVKRAYMHAANKLDALIEDIEDTDCIYFSLVKHDQDAIVGLPVKRDDLRDIDRVKGWHYVAMDYANLLRKRLTARKKKRENGSLDDKDNHQLHITHDEAKPMIQVLKSILEYCEATHETPGSSDQKHQENVNEIIKNEEQESIKDELIDHELGVENQIFNKQLPPSDISAQVRLAHLNLFEVLFHIIATPRSITEDTWADEIKETPLRWAYFIHRMCHRAATAIFKDNREIELLFAEKSMTIPPRPYCDFMYKKPAPSDSIKLGFLMIIAAQLPCRTGAVSLLRQLVNNNETLLDTKFKEPQVARIVRLIRDLGPQRRFLDLLSALCTCEDMLAGTSECVVSNQELIVLEMFKNKREQVVIDTSYLVYHDSETETEHSGKNDATSILGHAKLLDHRNEIRDGLILVRWEPDLMSKTPLELGCKKVYQHKKMKWANLEELLALTDADAKQLVEYYLGAISLYSKMCEGRSYNSISFIQKMFPYELLIVAINNDRLSASFRAAFTSLMLTLYFDRHPHTILGLPRQVHFKEKGALPNPGGVYGGYRDLPRFEIQVDHHLTSAVGSDADSDEEMSTFFTLNSPLKFDIFLRIAHESIERYNQLADEMKVKNTSFVDAIVIASTNLLSMGFFSTIDKIINFTREVIKMLPFHAAMKINSEQLAFRQHVCEFLQTIATFYTDHGVSLLIDRFETATNDTRIKDLVEGIATIFTEDNHPELIKWCLFDISENLTPKLPNDASVDSVLVDIVIKCGHLADPSIHLFEKALNVLMTEHSEGTRTFSVLEKVLVIDSEAGVRYFKTIKEKSAVLLNDVQSYETWGVSNEFSPIGWEIVSRVKSTLRYLRKACRKHGYLVDTLNIVDVVMETLRIESEPSKHLSHIRRLGLEFLVAYVEDNQDHQAYVFEELPLLVEILQENRVSVVKCLSAVVRNNRKLSIIFPLNLITSLVSKGIDVSVLAFFVQLCSVNGFGIKRNQDTVLQAILSDEHASVKVLGALEDCQRERIQHANNDFQIMLLELFSSITRGRNPYCEAKVQGLLSLDVLLDVLTVKHVEGMSNVFRCVMLRYLGDAFFDTGLTNSGSMQQIPRVIYLLESLAKELAEFVERTTRPGYDALVDTLSNYRALVFYGVLFSLRSFFQHAFEFQTAPREVLAIREPLLVSVQSLGSIAETPSEMHFTRRTRSAVLKSISGHRRKKKTPEERKRLIQINKERKVQQMMARKAERAAKRELQAGTRTRGKPNASNWDTFVRRMMNNQMVKSTLADDEQRLIQSIVTSCGQFDRVILFFRSLMDYVRASCHEHMIRYNTRERLPNRSDMTAQSVLRIVQFTLKYLTVVDVPWRSKHDNIPDEIVVERCQTRLTAIGAADLCFEIFCISTSDELSKSTITTLIALLEGGNRAVQERLFELLSGAAGEKYFKKLQTVFRTVGDAAKLEIKLEKKRTMQEDALMAREEGETASVISGNSSFLQESLGGTSSYGGSSKATSSCGKEEEDSSAGSDSECSSSSGDECESSDEEHGEGEEHHHHHSEINVNDLFELGAQRTGKNFRRKRNAAELAQKENAKHIVSIVRFLQLCMEGHYLAMQDLLRDQSETGHRHSINIILTTVNHAHILTKNDQILTGSKKENVQQVVGIFDFMIESMQGPCYENQLLLADPLHKVIEMIKKILLTSFTLSDTFLNEPDMSKITEDDVNDAKTVLELKGRTIRTLCSMLEGRDDTKVVEIFAGEIEASLLRNRFVEIYRAIMYYKRHNQQEEIGVLMEDAIDTMTVFTVLSDFHRNTDSSIRYTLCDPDNETATRALEYFADSIRSVEVFFKNSVHRVFYPKPLALNFLTHSARERLIQEIDVSDSDSKLREFLERARSLLDEVTHIQEISEKFPSKRILMEQDKFRYAVYGLGLMSNFLLIISVGNPETSSLGDSCSWIDSFRIWDVQPGAGISLSVVQFITFCQILLLLGLCGIHLGTQGPIVLKKLRRKIRVARTRAAVGNLPGTKRASTINVSDTLSLPAGSAPVDPFSILIWFILFASLSSLRFGIVTVLSSHGFFIAGKVWFFAQLVLFVKKARQRGGSYFKSDRLSVLFCCAYDVLSEVRTMFELVCLFSLIYGFSLGPKAYFLVVPLFDIVLSSETLLNVIRAVVVPFKSLLMTFFLLALTLYGFAFVGYVHFPDQFEDEDTKENKCEDLLHCFLLSLDIGLRVGEGPAAVMEKLAWSSPQSMQRYLYDLGFVVTITIFLLNVVFGIIIDTFGSLREEQHEREAQLTNFCFICNLPRADFDSISFEYKQKQDELPQGRTTREFKSGFLYHISQEHSLFDYLGFVLYLEGKDKTECNGLESYVLEELENSAGDSVSWIPTGTALALGNQGENETASQLDMVEANLLKVLLKQQRRLAALEGKLELILEKK
mmetsp:Transcript_33274/g.53603  ORF Transcript_33274/g.53603 Transcript_33274/m.53603 type:complete len:2908 (+) Transcript_33274:214-8937(+)